MIRTRKLILGRPGYSFGPVAQFDHDTLIMGIAGYMPQFTKPGNRVPFPVGLLTGANDSIRIILPLEGDEMLAAPRRLMTPACRADKCGRVRYPPNPVVDRLGKGFLAVRPVAGSSTVSNRTEACRERAVPLRRVAITSDFAIAMWTERRR